MPAAVWCAREDKVGIYVDKHYALQDTKLKINVPKRTELLTLVRPDSQPFNPL